MMSLLKRLATRRNYWISGSVFWLLTLLILIKLPDKLARGMGYTGKQSVVVLDGTSAILSSPETTYTLLSNYGETGRRATIVVHLLFDLIYPVSYALFFSISLTLTWQRMLRPTSPWRWFPILPWLAGLSDCLENTGIITMALAYPSQLRLVARITGILTLLKFAFFVSSVLLWLVGGVAWLLQRASFPRRKPFGIL